MRHSFLPLAAVLSAFLLFPGSSSAAIQDFDFSGNFQNDNDVLLLNFTVGTQSNITIFSSSWDDGGFDPILAIWDSAGIFVTGQDDGGNVGSTLSNGVLYDHGTWDSYFSVNLASGSYTASITQYDNFWNGNNLSDGFTHDGNPNFTFDLGFGGATQPMFNGVWDSIDPRTSAWAFHILDVEDAGVVIPEPATFIVWSLLGAIGVAAGLYRRRRAA